MYFDRKFTKAALKCMVLFGLALKAYFEHPTSEGRRKVKPSLQYHTLQHSSFGIYHMRDKTVGRGGKKGKSRSTRGKTCGKARTFRNGRHTPRKRCCGIHYIPDYIIFSADILEIVYVAAYLCIHFSRTLQYRKKCVLHSGAPAKTCV